MVPGEPTQLPLLRLWYSRPAAVTITTNPVTLTITPTAISACVATTPTTNTTIPEDERRAGDEFLVTPQMVEIDIRCEQRVVVTEGAFDLGAAPVEGRHAAVGSVMTV